MPVSTTNDGPQRRYVGFFADSSRWQRFPLRKGDVVITTPSKAGTTWMQHVVGMLLLGRTDLGAPISTLSPWLDLLTRPEAEVFDLLASQTHRRFIKTHTPLDGLPGRDDVTFIAVIRHPLDIALSDRDHRANTDRARSRSLRLAATGSIPPTTPGRSEEPEDPAAFLAWFIDNDLEPVGSGPYGLGDYCQQVRTYWDARDRPNVHLFHYSDLWADRAGEMRRVAEALDVSVPQDRWPDLVDEASLDSMRRHAVLRAPEADLGMWHDPALFFRQGGTRDWRRLLGPDGVIHFDERLQALAGDAAEWILGGRAALDA
jgi:hypothetical protein